MIAKAQKDAPDPYERALETTLGDLRDALNRERDSKKAHDAAVSQVAHLRRLAASLMTVVSPERRRAFEVAFEAVEEDNTSDARASVVFDNVVRLFADHKQDAWSAGEVRKELEKGGLQAESKSVHNVLGYLVRKGTLRRIARGKYQVVGAGYVIDTGDDVDHAERQPECEC